MYGQVYQDLDEKISCFILVKITNDWHTDIDRGNVNAVVFIDFEMAFNIVDDSILLGKLSHYGKRGKELEWLRSYLSERKRCCNVNGHISNIESIRHGVPQGSCLGPLLFLMYINDLPLVLDNANITMNADDTRISYSCNSVDAIYSAIIE